MGKVKMELSVLNPGTPIENVWSEYRKIRKKKIVLILIVTMLLISFYFTSEMRKSSISQSGQIERYDVGEISKEIEVDAEIDNQIYEGIPLEVKARVYSQEEAIKKIDEVGEKIPQLIIGENISLDYINKPLNLISKLDGIPISITWDSSNYGLMGVDGQLGTTIRQEGECVELNAILKYGDIEKTFPVAIRVYPKDSLSKEDYLLIINDSMTKAEESSRTEKYMQLPEYIDGKRVKWREHQDNFFIVLLLMIPISGVAVYIGMNQEIHKKYENRNNELVMDYSKFVCQIQLLIGSGLSVRESLIKIGNDYVKQKDMMAEKRYLYEELLLAIRKMNNGASEIEALEFFSKRCNLMCYKKVVSIISQNIKRGTEGLNSSLQEEVDRAFEERKQLAKKMGEEASTKLLLPMMLIMGMILIIIICPAFLSFGGI